MYTDILIAPCSFFKRLKILAVDELHYYTGLFGRYLMLIHSPDGV